MHVNLNTCRFVRGAKSIHTNSYLFRLHRLTPNWSRESCSPGPGTRYSSSGTRLDPCRGCPGGDGEIRPGNCSIPSEGSSLTLSVFSSPGSVSTVPRHSGPSLVDERLGRSLVTPYPLPWGVSGRRDLGGSVRSYPTPSSRTTPPDPVGEDRPRSQKVDNYP